MLKKNSKLKDTKKYPFYFYIVALIIPVLIIILLEIFLLLIGYGKNYPQWTTYSEKFPNIQVLSPDIAKRYFKQIKTPPSHNYDGFYKVKSDSAFRVFVMGGSSAAGFPYTISGAFSNYIRNYLTVSYPNSHIEVINIAMTAINTYSLKDLLPGVISQNPDLVIFYTGHNEYYGALGVASTESIGSNPIFINIMLSLKDYRIVKLLEDVIFKVESLFDSSENSRLNETLMSRMVNEQSIPYKSDLYYKGIEQFENNMRSIIDELNKNQIPAIMATIVSNLKDQPPFLSLDSDSVQSASKFFNLAKMEYEKNNFEKAENLYIKAKELDALRFRAPEAINQIILNLGSENKIPVVRIDSLFKASSKYGICGDNLFIDHLHPNITGNELIGQAFVVEMEKLKLVPKTKKKQLESDNTYSLSKAELNLTRLDSLQANLRIQILKNGWPYKKQGTDPLKNIKFAFNDYIDSLALSMTLEEITWEEAHLKAAYWYLQKNNTKKFIEEMKVLILHAPFNHFLYKLVSDELIKRSMLEESVPFLIGLNKLQPSAFSTKWLGSYFLFKEDYHNAIPELELSLNFNNKDSQVLYNLAGGYAKIGNYNKALDRIKKCLEINPGYPGAKILFQQLKNIVDHQ